MAFLWSHFLLQSQNDPHPAFRQYTTDEGLPSPETFYILQDQEGYIWIATDNGISRFDGYEFRNYSVKDGLKENVIYMMQLDTMGRLWMQAMSGSLYYMEGEVILPYWYNEVLQNLPSRPDYVKGVHCGRCWREGPYLDFNVWSYFHFRGWSNIET